ncbi:MAG: HAMP domain-containing sensor histidine kinase [Bacteroidota bacterium]
MNSFQNNKWKLILAALGVVIVGFSLIYTNHIVEKMKEEERKKATIWGMTIGEVFKDRSNMTYLLDVLRLTSSIPAILTDENGKIEDWNNLNENKVANEAYMQSQLDLMKRQHDPIIIEDKGLKQYIYRKNSALLTMLTYFPVVQFLLIIAFVIMGYLALNQARKAEQNRVWVGMAKETAHQLGTPITSLVAWIEHLKFLTAENEDVQDVLFEFRNDLGRLELIAERFSKIGSIPELKESDLHEMVLRSFDYMAKRAPRRVNFIAPEAPENPLIAKINGPLFDWVLENLLKNALDALEGKGEVSAELFEDQEFLYVDIADTGKGIPANNLKTVFQPGFTTKKRGWGLGLSLTKRIVENYHSGKIFVKESTVNQGTIFRIQLPKTLNS